MRNATRCKSVGVGVFLASVLTFSSVTLSTSQELVLSEIHFAARNGDVEQVKKLLSGDPRLANKQNEAGETPLHWAAIKGHLNIINLLLAFGADPSVSDYSLGGTPLHWATINNRLDVVKLLLASGANVNAQTKDGWTALHVASFQGHKEIADFLVAFGADVNAKDNEDMTPIDRAGDAKSAIVEMLVAKGADTGVQLDTKSAPDTEDIYQETDAKLDIIEEDRARIGIKQDITEERVKELKTRITELEHGVTEADRIIQDVRETIAQSQIEDRDLAEQRKDEIENVKKAQDSVIVRLKSELAAAETAAYNLERRLREAEKYKTNLETEKRLSRELWIKAREESKQLAELKQQNEHAGRETAAQLGELRRQIALLEANNTELEKENRNLKFTIKDNETKLSGIAKRSDNVHAIAETNAFEITKLQHALLNAAREIEEKESAVTVAERESAALKKALNQQIANVSERDKTIQTLQNQLDIAAQTVNETKLNAKTQTGAADMELAELRQEKAKLEKQLDERTIELNQSKKLFMEEQTASLRKDKELIAAMSELKNLRKDYADLQKSVRLQDTRMARISKELEKTDSLKAELDAEREKSGKLQKIMAAESMVRIKTENELNAVKKEYDRKIAGQESRIEQLNSELETERASSRKLRADLEALMTEKNNLSTTRAVLEKTLSSKDNEIAGLNSSVFTLRKNISMLSNQLADMKKFETQLARAINEKKELEKKIKLETSARLIAEMNATALKEAGAHTTVELNRKVAQLEREIRELKSSGRRLWNIFEETSKATGMTEQLRENRLLELKEAFAE